MYELIMDATPIIIIIALIIVLFCIYRFSEPYGKKYRAETKKEKEKQKLEHYDYEVPHVSLTDCGTQCTEGINCAGFGYKPVERMCYLSKTAILSEPTESIYYDQYSKLDRRCNKINRINDIKRIDGNSLTQNSIYVCSDGQNNVANEFQYANLGASALATTNSTIFDRADSDYATPQNVDYKVHVIKWPRDKAEQKIARIPYVTSESDQAINYGFIESDKEFLGQYLLAHQCVVNVPFYDCLKYCEKDPKCAGTEWNKAIVKQEINDAPDDSKISYTSGNYIYENVCCPKTAIKQVIPRRNEFNRGKFYVKKDSRAISNRDNLVFTKANFDEPVPPTNNRFDLKLTNYVSDIYDPAQQSLTSVEAVMDDIY
jgi:hypothetical protein